MSGDTIGIMDPAFFVSKSEILNWVNDLLKLNVQKIEQCATGAVYCQIIDAIYPGSVQMSKVNWQAKHDYEFAYNYKVLQVALQKSGISRYIDPTKLMKAKYQDNLEMMQWIKRYYDINSKGEGYDAVSRRKGADLYLIGEPNGKSNHAQPRPMTQPAAHSMNTHQAPAQKKIVSVTANVPFGNVTNKVAHSLVNSVNNSAQSIKQSGVSQASFDLQQQQLEHLQKDCSTKDDEILQLQDKIRMLEMRSQEVTLEKDMYFNTLSCLDEFVSQSLSQQDVQANQVAQQCLRQVQEIMMMENSNPSMGADVARSRMQQSFELNQQEFQSHSDDNNHQEVNHANPSGVSATQDVNMVEYF
eukprot:403351604